MANLKSLELTVNNIRQGWGNPVCEMCYNINADYPCLKTKNGCTLCYRNIAYQTMLGWL